MGMLCNLLCKIFILICIFHSPASIRVETDSSQKYMKGRADGA